MKKKIVVVYSSHLSDEENEKYNRHIKVTCGHKCEVVCYKNFNEYSLTELYNKALYNYGSEDTIMVFIHNDLVFHTLKWGYKLVQHFSKKTHDIIGLAGTTHIPESGMWWEDRTKMVGIVNHMDETNKWESRYSNEFSGIRDVVTIDGIFIAIDCDTIQNRFNEDFKGFHFYDLSFCFENYLNGCNIGVITDIRVTHKSIGQTNEKWEESRKQFVEEYKNELPLKHKPDLGNGDKLKILISCLYFNGFTGSEMSNYELAKELVRLGHDVSIISSQIGDPLYSKALKAGIKIYHIQNPPNYINVGNKLHFSQNDVDFDILHLNHKPIATHILQLYSNTPAVMHVRSEVIPIFEEPIINPVIKKYISIRDSITDYIKSFDIEDKQIVHIDNPFDYTRFNTNYTPQLNNCEVVLFVGTLDHLRKEMLFDLAKYVNDENQKLWIIGKDSLGYVAELLKYKGVEYYGIKEDVEFYIKKCDVTAGILLGRTTIEGFLCGKKGWIYDVDKEGKILGKKLVDVPEDVNKYRADVSVTNVVEVYKEVLG